MTARDDLLAAARRLTDGGCAPFSPAELIQEARRGGSNYPDTTLRTHIVGCMCVNSPDNHAVQYGDLVRVGRGLYRLARAADGPVGAPREAARGREAGPRTAVPHPHRSWFWEGNVQAALVAHLAATGWSIRRVADTAGRERGVDVEAERDGTTLLVEVKGYPADAYASGPRTGEPKRTPAPLQARASFSHARLAGVLLRAERPGARVVVAFPAVATYRTLADRTQGPLADAGIEVWLVDEQGAVSVAGGPT